MDELINMASSSAVENIKTTIIALESIMNEYSITNCITIIAMVIYRRYILNEAVRSGGVVVSNDNFRDLAAESPAFRRVVEEALLMYSWVRCDMCFFFCTFL